VRVEPSAAHGELLKLKQICDDLKCDSPHKCHRSCQLRDSHAFAGIVNVVRGSSARCCQHFGGVAGNFNLAPYLSDLALRIDQKG
jgi:hypothetical protein